MAAEPSHVPALLYLLYGSTAPSTTPRSNLIPPKNERNQTIAERYRSGESVDTLARQYQISEQRVYFIVRRERGKTRPSTPSREYAASGLTCVIRLAIDQGRRKRATMPGKRLGL